MPASAPLLTRADGSPLRALVVDDERDLADVLARMLGYEGWTARSAYDVAGAMSTAAEFEPDAVVLDVTLPDGSGFDVLRRLRTVNPTVCVLFLTARDAVEDRIAGITAGGDDYVTKPFSVEEVFARLRGLVRRAGLAELTTGEEIVVGELRMNEEAREVVRDGQPVENGQVINGDRWHAATLVEL